jgi:DNA-binding response OmpR family regulator
MIDIRRSSPTDVDLTSTGATVLTERTEVRRLVVFRHRLLTAAYRAGADCERMLAVLHHPDRRLWRECVGEALLAARHLLAVVQAGEGSTDTPATQRLFSLGAQVLEPKRRICDAMERLMTLVPVTAEDEVVLQDARTVRLLVGELLAFHQGAGDATGDRVQRSHPERSARAPAAAGAAVASRVRILVAEDEQQVAALLERRLERLGYHVILAPNGRAALDVATRDRIDLVITDINMPELDGIGLLQELKRQANTRDIPVIVISSQDDLASVANCIEQGAEDHLSKPFDSTILQARIRACVERKRLRDQELDYLAGVARLTEAAREVEGDTYQPGSLAGVVERDDALGHLARVFDRVVTSLRTRHGRLEHRVRQLRHEIGETHARPRVEDDPTTTPFSTGEFVAARYEILGHLGRGGMGMVYRARDTVVGEELALKVVRHELIAADPNLVERLKSEMRLARKITHRNVVRSHDLGEWKGTYFITMEHVKGITLEELLDRRGRLTPASALAIGTQLCDALAVAHEAQIIHRDIKPANLLIDQEGVLKISDFGLARVLHEQAGLTLGGYIIGTPQYMAPELLFGGAPDVRTDLFSVGVVLYECLAGRAPFAGDSPLSLAASITAGDVVSLSSFVPDVPAGVSALVHQLIHFQSNNRPASAREVANKLAELEHVAG